MDLHRWTAGTLTGLLLCGTLLAPQNAFASSLYDGAIASNMSLLLNQCQNTTDTSTQEEEDGTQPSTTNGEALAGNQDAMTAARALLNGEGVDLKGLRFNKTMVAGMFGNFMQESGVHFRVTQNHAHDDYDNDDARAWASTTGLGLGLAQWSGTGDNGRGVRLVDRAKQAGKHWYDGDIQLQHLIDEMAPGGGRAYSYEPLTKAKDAKDAARIFHNTFENSADTATTTRENYAATWKKELDKAIGLNDESPATSSGDTSNENTDDTNGQTKQCDTDDDRQEKIDAYLDWAKQTADDDQTGYSMSDRLLDPDVDCSSFVYYALVKGAGFDDPGSPFDTANEAKRLEAWGFEKTDGTSLERGDILLDPTPGAGGHTEIVWDDTQSIGAHSDNGHPEHGDQDKHEVSIEPLWHGYKEVWRYPGNNADTTTNATFGEVGGAPTDRHDFGWMCDTALRICHDGDYGRPNISWGGDYQCYWYWLARSYIIHDGDIQNPMTAWGGQLAAEVGTRPGWTRSDSPKPGAGVSFIQPSAGINHVAVVEKVESDPSGWKMMISEGNYNGSGSWNSYNTRWLTKTQYEQGGGQGFFWKTAWKNMG